MDFVIVAGPLAMAVIFGVFAVMQPPGKFHFRENLFLLLMLSSMMITLDFSARAALAPESYLNSTTITGNTTVYEYATKSSVFPETLTNNAFTVMGAGMFALMAIILLRFVWEGVVYCYEAYGRWKWGDAFE